MGEPRGRSPLPEHGQDILCLNGSEGLARPARGVAYSRDQEFRVPPRGSPGRARQVPPEAPARYRSHEKGFGRAAQGGIDFACLSLGGDADVDTCGTIRVQGPLAFSKTRILMVHES